MEKSESIETNTSNDGTEAAANDTSLDCPICLQSCVHPARLPCGHIFCFLCIKGVAYKNQRCAMCRRDIPAEFLDRPQLVNGMDDLCTAKCTEDGYQWFYEGRNGWWQYDVRTSQDIEDAYKKGQTSCTILVAGYVYTVDLETMVQQRQNEPSRCRRVKRDLKTVPKKGVAGLRLASKVVNRETDSGESTVNASQDIASSSADASFIDHQIPVSLESDVQRPQRPSNDIELTNSGGGGGGGGGGEEEEEERIDLTFINPIEQQSNDETRDLVTFVNTPELPNNFELPPEVNFFQNSIESSPRGSEQHSDDGFQETLSSLQQLTLRAIDASSFAQISPSELRDSRYRNNH